MAAENLWQDVWRRKGGEVATYDLESLMRADGFDTGTGSISVRDWLRTSDDIKRRLQLQQGHSVLEVGCGAGAMLWTLQDLGLHLCGVDYSETLIATARKAMPSLDAKACEAAALDYPDACFDAVFSHGVFFYFPDLDYAQRAMDEIRRVLRPGGGVYVLDVPDSATMEACEDFRRNVVYAGEDYPTAPEGPYRHLYYPRSWFEDYGARHGFTVQTFDQDLPSYPMSPYRFNALLLAG